MQIQAQLQESRLETGDNAFLAMVGPLQPCPLGLNLTGTVTDSLNWDANVSQGPLTWLAGRNDAL